jgi:hypothetical protein
VILRYSILKVDTVFASKGQTRYSPFFLCFGQGASHTGCSLASKSYSDFRFLKPLPNLPSFPHPVHPSCPRTDTNLRRDDSNFDKRRLPFAAQSRRSILASRRLGRSGCESRCTITCGGATDYRCAAIMPISHCASKWAFERHTWEGCGSDTCSLVLPRPRLVCP